MAAPHTSLETEQHQDKEPIPAGLISPFQYVCRYTDPVELHVSPAGRETSEGRNIAMGGGALRMAAAALPPSRELDRRLSLARTTVTLACDGLPAGGW